MFATHRQGQQFCKWIVVVDVYQEKYFILTQMTSSYRIQTKQTFKNRIKYTVFNNVKKWST